MLRLFLIFSIMLFSCPLFSEDEDIPVVLNRSSIEENIEAKRRMCIGLSFVSFVGERIIQTENRSPKMGIGVSAGFELVRDKFMWEVYTLSIPKSYFTDTVQSSIFDLGINFKGLISYSRYSSVYGSIGILQRRELKNYTAYSAGIGIYFNPFAEFSISAGLDFKSSFQKFDFPTAVGARSFELLLKSTLWL